MMCPYNCDFNISYENDEQKTKKEEELNKYICFKA